MANAQQLFYVRERERGKQGGGHFKQKKKESKKCDGVQNVLKELFCCIFRPEKKQRYDRKQQYEQGCSRDAARTTYYSDNKDKAEISILQPLRLYHVWFFLLLAKHRFCVTTGKAEKKENFLSLFHTKKGDQFREVGICAASTQHWSSGCSDRKHRWRIILVGVSSLHVVEC